MKKDTIVAIATPSGQGGVGIVRISGEKALSIALSLTRRQCIAPRVACYSSFYDVSQTLIDQGIVVYFQGPKSFTGEDVVEFQVHGSPMVLECLLQESIALGARLARPGEFSERAFLNDKLDLVQAEAIADLIHAHSQTAAKMAVRSLQGDFSAKINALSEQLISLRLYVEASIDFPEEEIDFLSDGYVLARLSTIIDDLQAICNAAHQGVIMRDGLSLVIVGPPNAGKSTLINSLAARDVSIVTSVAGTTRDVMREHILLDDIPVHVVDTAGLHDSDDLVEQEGIKRAWNEIKTADCVLMVLDIHDEGKHDELKQAIRSAVSSNDVPVIEVLNKVDLASQVCQHNGKCTQSKLLISAKTGEGMGELKQSIKSAVHYHPEEGTFLARQRHMEALSETQRVLLTGKGQLEEHRAGELLADDLRVAHQQLTEITGEFTSDDLLGRIFSSFCIGK